MVPKSSAGRCGDFRRLNDVTTPDCYPVPYIIQDFTANLAGAKIFSKINLVRGYHQIPVHLDDVPKTAVITPFGLWEFSEYLSAQLMQVFPKANGRKTGESQCAGVVPRSVG